MSHTHAHTTIWRSQKSEYGNSQRGGGNDGLSGDACAIRNVKSGDVIRVAARDGGEATQHAMHHAQAPSYLETSQPPDCARLLINVDSPGMTAPVPVLA